MMETKKESTFKYDHHADGVDELEKPAEVILTYRLFSEIVLYHLYVYKVYFHDVSPLITPVIRAIFPTTVQSFDMFPVPGGCMRSE